MNDDQTLDHEDSETQRMLRDAVRAYAQDHWPWRRMFDLEKRGATLPADELARVHEMGWLTMLAPERLGGAEISLLDAAVVLEELGYAGVSVLPVTVANVAMQVLAAAKNDAFDEMVRQQAAQKALYTLSEALRWSGISAQEMALQVVDGRLQGTLDLVPWAHLADGVVVPVLVSGRQGIAVVPLKDAKVRVNGTMDAPHHFSVDVDGVALTRKSGCSPMR